MKPLVFLFAIAFALDVAAQNHVMATVPTTVDPGLPFTVNFQYINSLDESGVYARITFPVGFVIQGVKSFDYCEAGTSGVSCAVGSNGSAQITVRAPDILDGASFKWNASITLGNSQSAALTLPRTFVVDNANDNGPGSLRAAIDAANAGCAGPCKIAFRLGTPPMGGYHTIAPATALPAITGNFTIDGTTQTRGAAGDTNPDGPEIFLDGSNLTSSDGLALHGCFAGVQGLAIGNFPGAGVHLLEANCDDRVQEIADNYLGVDPSGLYAVPNERGVVADQVVGYRGERRPLRISHNIISANRRSGIFLVSRPTNPVFIDQTSSPIIDGNTIGLDRNRQPLGNGASGIYVDGSAIVYGNYIAFNHQFGIGVADTASAVDVGPNSIFANWQMGIDIGLHGVPSSDAPVIRSARYDRTTNRTLVELVVTTYGGGNILPILFLYACDAPHSTGYGDGQYFLLGPFLGGPYGPFNVVLGQPFTVAAAGDWRGKWVSATQTARTAFENLYVPIARTSGFSRAVKVE